MIAGLRQVAVLAGMSLLTLASCAAATQNNNQCKPDVALFPDAGVAIRVEIADDPAERAQGLMNRESLARMTGMLFIYETPRPASFWMKNTLIPLDMVFMDAQGTIRHIHPSAVPLDLTPVPGNRPGDPDPNRLMVLEIGGGEAAVLGLREGMGMAFPGLEQTKAKERCQ